MNKIIKNTLILTAITVVSGLLLGIVYDVTKSRLRRRRSVQNKGVSDSASRGFRVYIQQFR